MWMSIVVIFYDSITNISYSNLFISIMFKKSNKSVLYRKKNEYTIIKTKTIHLL